MPKHRRNGSDARIRERIASLDYAIKDAREALHAAVDLFTHGHASDAGVKKYTAQIGKYRDEKRKLERNLEQGRNSWAATWLYPYREQSYAARYKRAREVRKEVGRSTAKLVSRKRNPAGRFQVVEFNETGETWLPKRVLSTHRTLKAAQGAHKRVYLGGNRNTGIIDAAVGKRNPGALWSKGKWRIEWFDSAKHWRGFTIANGVRAYHATVYSPGDLAYDRPEAIPKHVRAAAKRLSKQYAAAFDR